MTRHAFTAEQLHWRDTHSTDTLDVAIALTDGTALHLDAAPVGVTPLQHEDGSPHDHLALAFYADGWCIENCWPGATQNLAGSVTVKINGTQTFQQHDVQFWLRARTAMQREGLPQYTPSRPDPDLLPAYADPGKPLNSFADSMNAQEAGINGRGYALYDGMGNTGGRADIGMIPGWDLPWAVQGAHWQDCRDANDHSAVWPMHVRDPETGLPLDPSAHPVASLLTAHLGYKYGSRGTNPITTKSACPYTPDAAHQTHFAVVPYLSTHSDFDMEEIAFWGSYQGIWNNADYREYGKAIVSGGQTRGIAWGLAQYGYTAKLLPDEYPLKASFRQMLKNTAEYWWSDRFAPGKPQHNMFGVFPEFIYPDTEGRRRGVAPWQNYYLAPALQMLVHYGFDEFTGWRDYSAGFAVNAMTKLCWQMASMYEMYFVDPSGYDKKTSARGGTPLHTSWDQVKADTLANAYKGRYADQSGLACGEMALSAGKGLMSGATGNHQSYPAMLQPALAAGVDAGLDGAEKAWALHQQYSGQIDYTQGNENNIVPRGVVPSRPPAQSPAPAPAPSPAPAPATTTLQHTRKGRWTVNGDGEHDSEVEAFEEADNIALASPGAVIIVQPPGYEVVAK